MTDPRRSLHGLPLIGFAALLLATVTSPDPVTAEEVPICNHKACVVHEGNGEGDCEFVEISGNDTNCTDPMFGTCNWGYCPG